MTRLVTKAGQSGKQLYTYMAIVSFNVLVLVIGINLVLAIVYILKDLSKVPEAGYQHNPETLFNPDGSPVNNGKRTKYQLDWFDFTAYGSNRPGEVAQILDEGYEMGKLGFVYQPWVEFSQPPFRGRHITVEIDPRGFAVRRTVNPPNPQNLPVVTVFTLGGSTTFGASSEDANTWPSHLSRILNDRAQTQKLGIHVEVVNYGVVYYYPSQETALMVDLLKSGHRPNLMLFMDGLNWGSFPYNGEDVPQFAATGQLTKAFENLQFEPDAPLMNIEKMSKWVPMVRWAKAVHKSLSLPPARASTPNALHDHGPPFNPDYVINLFRQNRQIAAAIGNSYGIKPIFFLQPNALYNYPEHLYRRSLPDAFVQQRHDVKQVYERMKDDEGVIYLGDLFRLFGPNRKVIIDDSHYSPQFNQFLAEQVSKNIALTKLVPRTKFIDEAVATGAPRRIVVRNAATAGVR